MLTAIIVVAGYVFGSMPWGYWLVRIFRHEDIRAKGSGNIGASNVWRVYGRYLGLPVVLLDTAKGFVPALVGTLLVGHGTGVLAGAAAMLGHYRPLFLKFQKGGKMVATAGGAFLGVAPLVGGLGAVVWIVVFLTLRYPSLASMVSAVSLIAWSWLLGYPWPVTVFAAVAAAGVIVLHKANLQRLVRGEEHRSTLWRRWIRPSTSP
jgi:glycerol-3-phosphate acyltransferase PlsY